MYIFEIFILFILSGRKIEWVFIALRMDRNTMYIVLR